MPQTLAQLVRSKHPGAYDDLNDQALEAAVLKKYPGTYDDLPRTGQTPVAKSAPASSAMSTAGDVAVGAAKGLGNTVFGLGKIVHDYTPIGRISDAIQPGVFDQRLVALQPTNTAQRVGYTGEQIGEFFLPVGEAGALARAGRAAGAAPRAAVQAAGTTLAQTGSPAEAGLSGTVTGAITAAIPGVSAVARGLKASAQKSVAQALGATKEGMKTTAAELAPGMLARGVKGSRAAMLEQAAGHVQSVGAQIGAEIQAAAQAGQTVAGDAVRNAIRQSAAPLHVMNAQGTPIPIAGAEAAVKQLRKLDQFVGELGADIPFDKAAAVKTAWDRIVSKAGLYGPKTTSSATDNANAWAIREAASSFRELLAQGSPTLDALNQEFKFWKGLKTVLTETERRTQAQGGGLVSGVTGSIGAASGFASGQSMGDRVQNAVIGGVMGRQLVRVLQSPAFRTAVAGPLKDKLADALATGEAGKILTALGKVTAALPAQLRPAPAP